MTNTSSKKGIVLQSLIEEVNKEDHWDMLEELRLKIYGAAQCINTIRNSLEMEDVAAARRELTPVLVKAMLLTEILRVKLSILPAEWNKNVDRTVELWLQELAKKNKNFDEYEF